MFAGQPTTSVCMLVGNMTLISHSLLMTASQSALQVQIILAHQPSNHQYNNDENQIFHVHTIPFGYGAFFYRYQ